MGDASQSLAWSQTISCLLFFLRCRDALNGSAVGLQQRVRNASAGHVVRSYPLVSADEYVATNIESLFDLAEIQVRFPVKSLNAVVVTRKETFRNISRRNISDWETCFPTVDAASVFFKTLWASFFWWSTCTRYNLSQLPFHIISVGCQVCLVLLEPMGFCDRRDAKSCDQRL
ncbi:hypothetical protein M514_10061 [Trichuris suis]|uniref:Secreted protein n=1 Tax=Trichuris suis TaxID=68888 RepID=A0A085LVL7_9BILA|nr:hypothetical protein M513_10061 [Trichuris suis]KFD60968.1 hypothetical protein M514_10061 [Trichuris suis]